MTILKSVFNPLLTICAVAGLLSCNNNADAGKEPAKAADTVAAAPVVAAPPAFEPFDVLEVNHLVKDYAAWRPVYDADSVNRKAAGLETIVVARSVDNAKNIELVFKVTDVQKAKDFTASPKLKEAMAKGGVVSKPSLEFYHVLRFNAESKEKQWVEVSHKVKDFDAWLKVYDGEGKEKRAGEGMIDVVLARGIDDPSIVKLVFDITDMAKAKAAIFSEEKKKLMTSAGVEGKPVIKFYQVVE
jgi:hypothetical protein